MISEQAFPQLFGGEFAGQKQDSYCRNMASFTEIPALRQLMAPTRAAAHRRRRLRKIGSALCVGLAVFIIFGSSHRTTPSATPPASKINLAGLHLISITADPGIVAAATPGTHVDLWSARGTPIATSLPVARSSSSGGVWGNGSTSSLLVGLTDTQMGSYAQARARSADASNAILVTLSSK